MPSEPYAEQCKHWYALHSDSLSVYDVSVYLSDLMDPYHVLEVWQVHAVGELCAPYKLHMCHDSLGSRLHRCCCQTQHHILSQVPHKKGHMAEEGCTKQVSLQVLKVGFLEVADVVSNSTRPSQ